MGYKSLITLMCLLAVIYRAQANPKTTYKSAVVTLSADREGGKVKNPTVEQLAKMVEENIRKFEKFIDLAGGQKVDILVFPEAMLNYDVMPDNNVTTGQFAVEVPGVEKRIAPCDEPTYKEILSRLCKAVKKAQVYTVVNIIERVNCKKFPNDCGKRDLQMNLFNTNIVFDRDGTIIARYRKTNLFTEILMNQPRRIEMEPFTTDFGEEFFSIICFDLLFDTPPIDVIKLHGVKNIILTTYWFSVAPFLVAPQIQMGFAVANGVNLLAANAISLDLGVSGSGIYSGNTGIVRVTIKDTKGVDEMLIGDLPKANFLSNSNVRGRQPTGSTTAVGSNGKIKFTNKLTNLLIKQHHFASNTHFEPITTKPYSKCHQIKENVKHCCNIETEFKKHELKKGETGYHYYFVSFGGRRRFGGTRPGNRDLGELFCAIVACTGTDPKNDCGKRYPDKESELYNTVHFKSIKVKSTVETKTKDHYLNHISIMPSTLDVNMVPMSLEQYLFKITSTTNPRTTEISTSNKQMVYTFGLYGRNFNDDDDIKN